MKNDIVKKVDEYYSEKIKNFGASPKGVDWKDADGQYVRFEQLLRIIQTDTSFSVGDLGCGYGQLFEYMCEKRYQDFTFTGIDISESMIEQAILRYGEAKNAEFLCRDDFPQDLDYITASGIFNVKLGFSSEQWEAYVFDILEKMNTHSIKGFSCNFLTSYSDPEYMRPDLYYADPCKFFDYCKKKFSRNVSLIHDYNLYEFTLLIRKIV